MEEEIQRYLAQWKEQTYPSPEGIRIEKEYSLNEDNRIELLWFIYLGEEEHVETYLRKIVPSNTIDDLDSIIRTTEEKELPILYRT